MIYYRLKCIGWVPDVVGSVLPVARDPAQQAFTADYSQRQNIKTVLKAKIQQEQFKVKLFSTQQVMAIVIPLS